MKNLFEKATTDETITRLERMSASSERQWGKMNPAQALAHCSMMMEAAVGDWRPKRMPIGRVLGPLMKNMASNEKPMGKNSPTDPAIVVSDEREFGAERARLEALLRRFQAGGPAGCTDHPHSFFGRLTPEEWASLQWKHLDHHLRQFGV